jgi:CHRD domain
MRLRVFLAAALLVVVGSLAFATAAGATGSTRILATVLTGANEIGPEGRGAGDPDGIGAAVITLNTRTDTVCWLIAVTRIELPATAAHIHFAPAGSNGPVVVPLSAPNAFGFSFGCVQSTHTDAIAADPAAYYVNVHNVPFPAGALRGQLG